MGKRRKRRKVEERQARQELRRQVRTLLQVQLSQGCRMRGTVENMEGGVGYSFTGGAEEAGDQSYPLTIEMEGATERRLTL